MEDFGRVSNKMPSGDVVTWNAILLGHGKCGQGQKALELFQQMQQEGAATKLCYFCAPWLMHVLAHSLQLKRGQVCL